MRKQSIKKIRKIKVDNAATLKQKPTAQTFVNGRSFEPGVRQFFESKVNADFNHVQIHNDKAAHQYAAFFNARAFTYNNHIFFNKGEYKPNSYEGKKLLAHELAHIRQEGKNSNIIFRTPDKITEENLRKRHLPVS